MTFINSDRFTEVQSLKEMFVRIYLEPLLKAVDKNIGSVVYMVTYDGREFVDVSYKVWTNPENGYPKYHDHVVDVTADSPLALVRDVLKKL